MPKTKNISKAQAVAHRRAVTRPNRGQARTPRPLQPVVAIREQKLHPAFIDREGGTHHVLLPVDEYERLLKAEMALQAIAQIENEKDEDFIDADDLAIELATESVVKARKAAGLTQAQLAKKLGMPQSQISRIERNPDRTTVRTLKKIAKALRVDVRAFV